MLSPDDNNLVVFLAGSGAGCSLDSSPGSNWVQNSGGLPDYICKVAKGLMKSGKSKSAAIAIAVSTMKKWSAGGDKVTPATRAKAAKALAGWEALRAKNKANKLVKASREDGSAYLIMLSDSTFNTDIVRSAYNKVQADMRASARAQASTGSATEAYPGDYPYTYIRELWTDHILVEVDAKGETNLASIPYTVSNGEVTFGTAQPVEIKYVPVESDDVDDEFDDDEKALLGDLLKMSAPDTPLGRIQLAAQQLGV